MLIASKNPSRGHTSHTEQRLWPSCVSETLLFDKAQTIIRCLKCGITALFVQRRALLLAFCAGLLVAACHRQPKVTAPPPVPEVSVVTVARQAVLLTIELPGRTCPFRTAEIRPQVNGLIQKRLFTEGSEVKAGQDLYQIDPAPFQAVLDNAKAALGRSGCGSRSYWPGN